MDRLLEALSQLIHDVVLYKEQLRKFPGVIHVGLELVDTKEAATLILGEKIKVKAGLVKPDLKIQMTSEVLERIMKCEADAFALGSRAHVDDVRPINFEFYKPERIQEAMEVIKFLGMIFFTPGRIKTKQLRPELAGEAHGAHPIPLVYWQGLRSAWYYVEAGEVLNKAGEEDPWPQLFLPLSGKGRVKISEEEFELKERQVIYIPPNSAHQVIAEEPIELLWIAWDTE